MSQFYNLIFWKRKISFGHYWWYDIEKQKEKKDVHLHKQKNVIPILDKISLVASGSIFLIWSFNIIKFSHHFNFQPTKIARNKCSNNGHHFCSVLRSLILFCFLKVVVFFFVSIFEKKWWLFFFNVKAPIQLIPRRFFFFAKTNALL